MKSLADKVLAAVVAAVEDVRPDLERDSRSIRGVTVEVTLTTNGAINDALTYLERRKPAAGAVLDRHAARSGGS